MKTMARFNSVIIDVWWVT